MSNPFASGSNSEPIGGIQPNDGGGGRGGSAFPQTSSGKVTHILFYKQHMIKKTSWTFLDFIQSLLIFVA